MENPTIASSSLTFFKTLEKKQQEWFAENKTHILQHKQ
jgi:uncharacterized protein (DUF2461 family)